MLGYGVSDILMFDKEWMIEGLFGSSSEIGIEFNHQFEQIETITRKQLEITLSEIDNFILFFC